MKINVYLLLLVALFASFSVQAQEEIFSSRLDTSLTAETIRISKNLEYDILCISQDCTVYNPSNNTFTPMKGSFGTAFYLPSDFSASAGDSSGTVYVTHKTNEKNANLGDGGGLIRFNVKRDASNKWQVVSSGKVGSRKVYYTSVDLGLVGGSIGNGDIIIDKYDQTKRTILVSEGMLVESNDQLAVGMSNTNDYTVPSYVTQATNPNYVVPENTKIPKYEQMNWMVEVDLNTGDPTQKLYTMGRFNHAYCVKGLGGYYFTTGRTPSVLFKWVPNEPENLQIGGELFAFRQSEDPNMPDDFISLNNHKEMPDGTDSTWQAFDSLLVAEAEALRAGATMFANLSGLAIDQVEAIDVLYIAERGIDDSGDSFTNPERKFNGVLATHLQALDTADGNDDDVIHDYNGRILCYAQDSKLHPVLEGGPSGSGKYFFSNPQTIDFINGPMNEETGSPDRYMVFKENVNGIDHGRNPSTIKSSSDKINEAYWIKAPVTMDYSKGGMPFPIFPSLDSLHLFLAGPKGAELNGGSTYDLTESATRTNSYFVTVANPNPANAAPANRSMVVAVNNIWGKKHTTTTGIFTPQFSSNSNFQIWPNPAVGTLHFNKTTDVAIYNAEGILIQTYSRVNAIDVDELTPGLYFITNKDQEIRKLVVE